MNYVIATELFLPSLYIKGQDYTKETYTHQLNHLEAVLCPMTAEAERAQSVLRKTCQ